MKNAILFFLAAQLASASAQSPLDPNLMGDDDAFDFISVLADYQEAGGDAIMGCMMGDLNLAGLAMATDPIAAALDKFGAKNYCSESDAETFSKAMDDFEACSGYSLFTLIETFFGAMVGNGLHCASYMYTTFTTIANSMSLGGQAEIQYPLPRMPDECAEAVYGDNPFGNAARLYAQFPEKDTQCFASLANQLPDCTLNSWPIPITGLYLKAISCAYGNAIPVLEESCTRELEALSDCLPDGEYSADYQCTKAIQDCAVAEAESMTLDSLMRAIPPLLGRPLSDTCRRIGNSSGQQNLSNAMNKYDKFREYCVSAEDRAIWDIKPKNTLETTVSMASQVEDNGVAAPVKASSSAAYSSNKNSSNKSGGGGAGVFFTGLLIGVVVSMVTMLAVQKKHSGSRRNEMGRYNFVEQELA
jgi:hypothetical protein